MLNFCFLDQRFYLLSLVTSVGFLSAAVCRHHRNAGVNPDYGVHVCLSRGVPAHVAAAAAVRHSKEKKDGGNVQAQCRGEEADRSSGTWKARAASAVAQRRAPHMIFVFVYKKRALILQTCGLHPFFPQYSAFAASRAAVCAGTLIHPVITWILSLLPAVSSHSLSFVTWTEVYDVFVFSYWVFIYWYISHVFHI